MRRCEEFLGELRRQEHHLKDVQVKTTEELLQVQAARRAFEETLKEKLRAEQRAFGSEHWAELCSTKEEIEAGLQEIQANGGLELHEFIGELEEVLHESEPTLRN